MADADPEDAVPSRPPVVGIEVLDVEPVTPHNRAVYEAGKALFLESLRTGRDFCQFMITTSLAGVSVYLALLAYVSKGADSRAGGYAVVPGLLFVVSALMFSLGLLPKIETISLDVVTDIERALERIVRHRRNHIRLGFLTFLVATVSSVVVTVLQLVGTP